MKRSRTSGPSAVPVSGMVVRIFDRHTFGLGRNVEILIC